MERESKEGISVVSRRGFLTTIGVGAVAVVASGSLSARAAERGKDKDPREMNRIKLNINGRGHTLLVEPRWSLLFVLRERLGLTAAKLGCDRGECGACTVLIDGLPRYACMTLAVEAEGSHIVTLEGLMEGEDLGLIQETFLEHDAFQCGYCTPGQIVAAEGLLRKNPSPSGDEIYKGMSGNLCRCGAYTHIFQAVKRAAELKRGK